MIRAQDSRGLRECKICMVVDGGEKIGLGHLTQALSFATRLSSDSKLQFVTKSDPSIISKIERSGFSVTRVKDDNELLQYLKLNEFNGVIFDRIDVPEWLAQQVRAETRAKLIIFTNITAANNYAHIAVVADYGSGLQNIRYTKGGTQYFLGPKYWILRPEFYSFKKSPRRGEIARNMLLIFGGSDPSNFSSKVASHLLRLNRPIHIDIIVGSHFRNLNDIQRMLDAGEQKICLYQDVSNVAEMMFHADRVIASPGLSTFEALRIGSPVVVIPHDEIQKNAYKGILAMVEEENLDTLAEVLDLDQFSFPSDDAVKNMAIGEGVEVLKTEVLNVCGSRQ